VNFSGNAFGRRNNRSVQSYEQTSNFDLYSEPVVVACGDLRDDRSWREADRVLFVARG